MKSYPATLWQVISEPGEAMFRLGEKPRLALAALTTALPGLLVCAATLVAAPGQVTGQLLGVQAAMYVGGSLVFWLVGSLLCHGLARFAAGGQGVWRQMAVVYGFSYTVRLFEPLVRVVGGSGQQLLWALYLWQGAVIVIGMREVYGLSWLRSAASGLATFLTLAAALRVVPLYLFPFFHTPPVEAHGDPIVKPLSTPNLVVNPSFEEKDDAVLLGSGEIVDMLGLCASLSDAGGREQPSPGRRIWELLPPESKDTVAECLKHDRIQQTDAEKLTGALNSVLKRPDLYKAESFAGVAIPDKAKELLKREAKSLSDLDVQALNRLLLEAAYPRRVLKGQQYPRGFLKAWFPQIMALPGVSHGQDTSVARSGKACAFIAKTGLRLGQPNLFAQRLASVPDSGAIQASVWLKTKDVTRAIFSLYVLTQDKTVQQYNPQMLTGTHEWRECSIAATLPANVKAVFVGIGMWGKGAVWMDDVTVRTEFPPPPLPKKEESKGRPASKSGTDDGS